MSDNKKYYYLKLKENFFDSEEVRIMEGMPNSERYQIVYLKLCLLALKNEGALIFKDALPYNIKLLSTVLRVEIEFMKAAIEFFEKLELIHMTDAGIIYMSDIQTLVGRTSTEAIRKKSYRDRIGTMSQNRPPEKEKEKEIEIEKEIDTISKFSEKSEKEREISKNTNNKLIPLITAFNNGISSAGGKPIERHSSQLIKKDCKDAENILSIAKAENWIVDTEERFFEELGRRHYNRLKDFKPELAVSIGTCRINLTKSWFYTKTYKNELKIPDGATMRPGDPYWEHELKKLNGEI